MPKIFISYRRADSQWPADRLHEVLREHVDDPSADIFMDIDSIPIGVDFVAHLEGFVAQCDVLLALIGPDWLDARDAAGNRRLDDPGDFVRIEIAAALKRGIRVAPILLDGVTPPRHHELPDDLQDLSRRAGVEVRRITFKADAERLVRGLGLHSTRRREPTQGVDPALSSTTSAPSHFTFDPQRYVFISYPKDTAPELMAAVVRRLLAAGLSVWLYDPSPFGFSPNELSGMRWQRTGGGWESQTLEAINKARAVLALVGRATAGAQFQPREIEIAAKTKALAPVIVDDLPFADLPASILDRHTSRLDPRAMGTQTFDTALTLLAADITELVDDEALQKRLADGESRWVTTDKSSRK